MVFLEVNKQPNPKKWTWTLDNKCEQRYKGFCGLPIFFFSIFKTATKALNVNKGPEQEYHTHMLQFILIGTRRPKLV
jgi:hypothetical protein